MKKILNLHFPCKKKKKNYRDQERIFNSSVKLVLRYGWKLGEKPPGRQSFFYFLYNPLQFLNIYVYYRLSSLSSLRSSFPTNKGLFVVYLKSYCNCGKKKKKKKQLIVPPKQTIRVTIETLGVDWAKEHGVSRSGLGHTGFTFLWTGNVADRSWRPTSPM